MIFKKSKCGSFKKTNFTLFSSNNVVIMPVFFKSTHKNVFVWKKRLTLEPMFFYKDCFYYSEEASCLAK